VQTKINDLLNKNSTLAGYYQQFFAQLKTWTDEDLREFSPDPALLKPFRPKSVAVLGPPPISLRRDKEELVNEFLSTMIRPESLGEESTEKQLARTKLREFLVTTYNKILNKHSGQI